MSFIRIEVRMPTGPKFDRIPSAAGWLHVAALCYTGHNLTDGFIPAGQLYKLTNDRHDVVDRAVAWLTSVRPGCTEPLWHCVDGGWIVHDYDDPEYGNPTRSVADALREAAQRGGQRSAEVRRKKYGSAQPRTQSLEPPFGPPFGTASAEVFPEVSARSVPEARPVPPRTTPPRTTSPNGSSVEGSIPQARQETAPARRAAEVLTNPTEDPDVLAYAERFMHHAARAPSGADLAFLRRIPYECSRLSRDVVLAAIDEVADKHVSRGKPMPRATYLAGKLADLQAAASDAGVTSRARSPNGRLTHTSAPPRDPDDDDE